VWGLGSIVWTDPDSRQRNLLLGQKIDFDIAVAGSARPAVGASLTPRAIWRVVGLQYWGVYNPVPLFQHLCHRMGNFFQSGFWCLGEPQYAEKKKTKKKQTHTTEYTQTGVSDKMWH
jgi:hypothetical protein